MDRVVGNRSIGRLGNLWGKTNEEYGIILLSPTGSNVLTPKR